MNTDLFSDILNFSGFSGLTDDLSLYLPLGAAALITLFVIGILRSLFRRSGNVVLVDGSNVLHWGGEGPDLRNLRHVIDRMTAEGLTPEIVFDANAGWLLWNRYAGPEVFAKELRLPRSAVHLAHKGQTADEVLLSKASRRRLRIITNDRYRDWQDSFPALKQGGMLIRGRIAKGRGAELELRPAEVSGRSAAASRRPAGRDARR